MAVLAEVPVEKWVGQVHEVRLGGNGRREVVVGGGLQTPGMMGHGKFYIASKKFIKAEGGIKRVVWMSKNLKEEMAEELQQVCEQEGVPDLMDKIADGTSITTIEELVPFLEKVGHPALTLPPIL